MKTLQNTIEKVERKFSDKFCVMIERSLYSEKEIEEIYSFLHTAIKEAIQTAFEATEVKGFQHLTPVADRPKVECNHCWVLWNEALEAIKIKQEEFLSTNL